jgi:lantibiotic biosynthesis protein
MADGFCLRFSFDTYDREVERFGGPDGARLAERLFAADSIAVAEMLDLLRRRSLQLDRTSVAVVSVDALLSSLGLTEDARLRWYRDYTPSRHEAGAEYRKRNAQLRGLLGDPAHLSTLAGGRALAGLLARRQAAFTEIAERLVLLDQRGDLSPSLPMLCSTFVHLHCNRLIGVHRAAERQVLGLLLRTREGLDRSPYATPVHRDGVRGRRPPA